MRSKFLPIVVGIILLVTLGVVLLSLGKKQNIQKKAVGSTVNLSIQPATATVTQTSPTTVKVYLDPQGEQVVFAKVVVTFRPNQLKLVALPTISSKFENVVKTPATLAEVNLGGASEGKIELVAGVNPPDAPVTGPEAFATLQFQANQADVSPNVDNVGFDAVNSQIVTKQAVVLTISAAGAKLSTPAQTPTLDLGFKIQGLTAQGITLPVTVYVGTTQLSNVSVTSNTGGIFSPANPITLTGVAPGSYDIYVKHATHLRKKLGNMAIASGPNTAPGSWSSLSLKPGDFNNDNILNASDIGAILSQYTALSVTPTPTTIIFDVDQNGVINLLDISNVLANYVALTVNGD